MNPLAEPCFPADKLPIKAKVNLVEETADRVVIEVAPGGKTANILTMVAIFWNVICVAVCAVLFATAAEDLPFLILFAVLFLGVGIGLVVFAVRFKCTRTLLLLEHGQLAIRSILLGREKTRLYPLGENSHAQLVAFGETNGDAIHRVEVISSNGTTARFGHAMSEPEKQWLRNGMNRFLSKTSTAANRAVRSDIVRSKNYGRSVHPIDPVAIDQDSNVRVEENTGNTLRISWATIPAGKFRTVMRTTTMLMVLVLLVWAAVEAVPTVWNAVVRRDWVEAAFALPPFLGLMMTLSGAVMVWRSRTFVVMNDENITAGLGVGLLRWKKQFSALDVEWIAVKEPQDSGLMTAIEGADTNDYPFPGGCTIKVPSFPAPIPLSPGHPHDLSRAVGGVIRWHCERMGVDHLPEPDVLVGKECTREAVSVGHLDP